MKKRPVFLIVLIVILFFVSAVQPAFALEKWPGVTNMLNMALAAGSLLIYNTVWQVNNSVNGLVGDARAVYEAIKEDVTPKITEWWNNLSAEDQQAFTDKVRSDEDLMVSELIPQDIITDIVSESVGYNGVYDAYSGNVMKWNDMVLTIDEYNKLQEKYDSTYTYYTFGDLVYERNGELYEVKNVYMSTQYGNLRWTTVDGAQQYYSDYIIFGACLIHSVMADESYIFKSFTGTEVNLSGFMENAAVTQMAYTEWHPDDQQLDPFYYPVNNLKMADVWDIGTASDSDLTADTAIYNAVESETWDASAGVAESAKAVGIQGDVLVDNDSGLPFALGVVKPWEHTATDTATDTGAETEIDINSETIDWSPIRDLGQLLTDKFPFCLPFDVYDLFSNFVIDSPSAPSWTWNFDGNDVVIDLNYLDPIMDKVRPIELAVMSIEFYWLVFKTLSS